MYLGGRTPNLIGKKFGRLKVIKKLKSRYYGDVRRVTWLCKCKCGRKRKLPTNVFSKKKPQNSCGVCYTGPGCKHTPPLKNKRFGKLLVIEKLGSRKYGTCFQVFWKCKCDCGELREIPTGQLTNGKRVSCGCALRRGCKPGEAALKVVFRNYEAHAEQMNKSFSISLKEFLILLTSKCLYCGAKPRKMKNTGTSSHKYNGVDRVDNNKGYIAGNVVTCCWECNESKKAKSVERFLSHAEKIAQRADKIRRRLRHHIRRVA